MRIQINPPAQGAIAALPCRRYPLRTTLGRNQRRNAARDQARPPAFANRSATTKVHGARKRRRDLATLSDRVHG